MLVFSAFPKLPIAVDGKVVEITKDSDVAEVFAPLLIPIATKNKNTTKAKTKAMQRHESATNSKIKQQKLKKRKNTSCD